VVEEKPQHNQSTWYPDQPGHNVFQAAPPVWGGARWLPWCRSLRSPAGPRHGIEVTPASDQYGLVDAEQFPEGGYRVAPRRRRQ